MRHAHYWTCECRYPGMVNTLLVHSDEFYVIAETDLEALAMLEPILAHEWAKAVPYPPPPITAVIPMRLVLQDEVDEVRAEQRRVRN
ncbi:MAG: hypothetical protein ACREO8_11390 [Luteimonas sp.]